MRTNNSRKDLNFGEGVVGEMRNSKKFLLLISHQYQSGKTLRPSPFRPGQKTYEKVKFVIFAESLMNGRMDDSRGE